jgi:hypothetical protein
MHGMGNIKKFNFTYIHEFLNKVIDVRHAGLKPGWACNSLARASRQLVISAVF